MRRGVTQRLDFEDGEDDEEETVWREQFDSIHRDFNSATKENECRSAWMNVFGKYWIGQEYWCRDDVEMIHWLTTGANDAMVDTCSEHLGSSMLSQRDFQIKGSRLCRDVIDNPSKLLKVELGMQLPMKSIFKLRRDMQKFAGRNLLGSQHMSILDPYYWYFDGQLS